MEERILNINFYKSGSGSTSSKITLPITILRDMGLTKEDRKVKMLYDKEKKEIILKKL